VFSALCRLVMADASAMVDCDALVAACAHGARGRAREAFVRAIVRQARASEDGNRGGKSGA
jgi:hypothetical protein